MPREVRGLELVHLRCTGRGGKSHIPTRILRGVERDEVANEWRRSVKDDIMAMKLCYRNKMYGLSAYHCQQALEKAVKFVAVKYEIIDNPRKFDHDVLLQTFRILNKKYSTPKLQVYNKKIISVLCKIKYGEKFDKNKNAKNDEISMRDAVWADSLGVHATHQDLKNFIAKMLEETPEHLEDFLTILRKKFLKKSKKQTSAKNFSQMAVLGTAPQDNAMKYKSMYQIINHLCSNMPRTKQTAEIILFIWIALNAKTILKIAPHEEYGRYPGTLWAKTRRQYYRKKSVKLYVLEKEVCQAISNLYKMIG